MQGNYTTAFVLTKTNLGHGAETKVAQVAESIGLATDFVQITIHASIDVLSRFVS